MVGVTTDLLKEGDVLLELGRTLPRCEDVEFVAFPDLSSRYHVVLGWSQSRRKIEVVIDDDDEVDIIWVWFRRDEAAVYQEPRDNARGPRLSREVFEILEQVRTAVGSLESTESLSDLIQSAIVQPWRQHSSFIKSRNGHQDTTPLPRPG